MKRIGNLFDDCASFGHLLKSYHKARKGSNTPEAKRFGFFLEKEVLKLQEELYSGMYQPSPYRYFKIHDPKERLISVAPFKDRIVHHALVGILEPIYEALFIYHSYATRKYKGVHKCLKASQQMLKQYPWFYKADIHKFFDSISHDLLLDILNRKIKDQRFFELADRVIRNGGSNGKGLPIGNLTSQFFANVYLNSFDHFVFRSFLPLEGSGAYIRYMDDFVCFTNSRKTAVESRKVIGEYLQQELDLEINPSSSFINQRSNGLRFLGCRVSSKGHKLHRTNRQRIYRRMNHRCTQFQDRRITEDQFLDSMNSYWSHLSQFDPYYSHIFLLAYHNKVHI